MEYLREEYHRLMGEVEKLKSENAELKKYGSEMYKKYKETKRILEMLIASREKEAREIIRKKEEEQWEK